jgi:RNA polymerase sigma factor (sigma-70 family)
MAEQEGLWSSNRLEPQERGQLTNEILAVLPEPQRQTIEMYFFEGLTLKEIAHKRNENFANVRHHFYRGLDRLRHYLETGIAREVTGPAGVPSGEAWTS